MSQEVHEPQGEREESPDDSLELADAAHSTELPVVVLGSSDAVTGESPRERLLRGRVRRTLVSYPMYTLIILSGGLAGNTALATGEWSLVMVALGWSLVWLWSWLYGIAWTYERRVMKTLVLLCALGMEAALIFFCLDRAAPQRVVRDGMLVDRASLESLYWVAAFLGICSVLKVVHFFFLGRGYRKKPLGVTRSSEHVISTTVPGG